MKMTEKANDNEEKRNESQWKDILINMENERMMKEEK